MIDEDEDGVWQVDAVVLSMMKMMTMVMTNGGCGVLD